MAKAKQKVEEAVSAGEPKETKPKAPPKEPEIKQVKLLREPKEGEKLAPQALGIIACLKANGRGMPTNVLVEKLNSHVTTKQPTGRIWQYYRGDLIDQGYISVQ